jgi:Ca2+-binding EF-hand superfamily protein
MIIIPLQALASTLNEEELADLHDQFNAIDVDKNGKISLEEMREVSILVLNSQIDFHRFFLKS